MLQAKHQKRVEQMSDPSSDKLAEAVQETIERILDSTPVTPGLRGSLERLVQTAYEVECLRCARIVLAQDVDPGFKHRIAQGILNRQFQEYVIVN